MDETRTNCIIKDLENLEEYYLSLTDSQLKFFNWLNRLGLVDNIELKILQKQIHFEEV